MITMRPIDEPAVIESLNNGRFTGNVCGYVVMDGPQYLGHLLYTVDGDTTAVQECGLKDTSLVDGGVRACVAAGENAGAVRFCVNAEDAALAAWQKVFCKAYTLPAQNAKLFHSCK